jgi:transcription elongation factor SPT5
VCDADYYGIVKDATDTTCRVELHARGQTITVDKSRIHILGEAAPPVSGTPGGAGLYSAQTPRAPDGATPMYAGGRTPMGGGATPMYGNQTPMHEGGRTPYYGGGATPAYDEAGGRTPGRSAWDPTGANTPART